MSNYPKEIQDQLRQIDQYGISKGFDDMKRKTALDTFLKSKGLSLPGEQADPAKTGPGWLTSNVVQPWKAGALGVGRAMTKAYQQVGGIAELGAEAGKQVAYLPEIVKRETDKIKYKGTSTRYLPKTHREHELKSFELAQGVDREKRYQETQPIVDHYDRQIQDIY
jgi:hypothetical protein